MDSEKALERISEIRDEMLTFAVEQAGSRVNKLFVQGKVTDVVQGRITGAQGNLRNVVVANRVLEVSKILDDRGFKANVQFVRPRVMELHDVLHQLQVDLRCGFVGLSICLRGLSTVDAHTTTTCLVTRRRTTSGGTSRVMSRGRSSSRRS